MSDNQTNPDVAAREKAREIIDKVKESSENDYEKNLIYITAGTLVLSLTFIEKISPLKDAINIWLVVTAWGFLAFSLSINLFSHWFSAQMALKIQRLLNDRSKSIREINQIIDDDGKWANRINIGTFVSMIFGIIFLVLYCSFNAFHMSNLQDKRSNNKQSKTDTIQKGRVMSPISDYNPAPQPTSQPAQTPTQAPAQPAQTSTPPQSSDTSGN